MPALVAGIHVLNKGREKDVDGRDKPGQDGKWCDRSGRSRPFEEQGCIPQSGTEVRALANLEG